VLSDTGVPCSHSANKIIRMGVFFEPDLFMDIQLYCIAYCHDNVFVFPSFR
jgi:hypothetical protein